MDAKNGFPQMFNEFARVIGEGLPIYFGDHSTGRRGEDGWGFLRISSTEEDQGHEPRRKDIKPVNTRHGASKPRFSE
jgi:hypothetical protein